MRCFRPSAKYSGPVDGPTIKLPKTQAAEVYCVANENVTSFSPPSAPPAPPPRASAPFEETEYQHLSSKLMQMLHSLRSIGAHHQLELPLVVVCGNQSAGKSSLIEALCGVPLPRSDGTCTRCPLEVRMSSAPISSTAAAATAASHGSLGGDRPGWSCAIKLRREYSAQGNKLTAPEEALFQGGIGSRRDVERLLRTAQERLLALDSSSGAAAQAAVAKGGAPPSPGDCARPPPPPGVPSVGFSRNVLVLEISGAPVDLVLVDLPGIIHSVERPDDLHFRDVVLDLVRSYIHRESAVIVSVISCKEDIDTQSILGIAREADPRGTRTVGVLTKPDQIEPACHRQWLDVLQGRRYPLALGYYMVRNPGQQQLLDGIRSEDARRAESSFFSSTPPWASMAHAEGSRLGTVALRNSLSQVLVELTRQALPGLQAEATSRLHMVEGALDKLPPPPPAAADDPRRALLVMADMAVGAVRRQLLAGGAEKAFYQRLLMLSREFKAAIYATKPKYVVGNTYQQDPLAYAFTCITDGDQESLHEVDTANRLRFVLSLVAVPPPTSSSSPEQRSTSEQRVAVAGTALTLEDVRLVIEQHRGLELPGFSPYSAVQALIARTTSAWSEAVDTLLERSVDAVSAVVVDATSDVFGRFPEAYRLSRSSAQALVQQLRLTCLAQVRGLVQMEQSNAFTMNRTDFESTTADVLQQLREAYYTRHMAPPVAASPAKVSGSTPPGKGSAPAAATGGRGAQQQQRRTGGDNGLTPALRRSIGGGGGDDEGGGFSTSWLSHDVSDEQILGMMAVSLTYFVVSSRRIVDYVPLHVMHYLVGTLAEQLKGTLVDALMAGASEGGQQRGEGRDYGARWMLREEAGDAATRAELRAQRDLLENVLTSLRY